MKKSIFTISLLFLGLNTGISQNIPDFLQNVERVYDKENYQCIHSQTKHPVLLKDNIPLIKRNYDVLRYDLYMDWYNMLNDNFFEGGQIKFNGINKILLRIDSNNVDFIELDALKLTIDSVMINGEPSQNSSPFTFGTFKVNFNKTYNQGDTVLFEIAYRYSTTDLGGIFLYEKNTPVDIGPPPDSDTIYTEEKIAYTMAEPIDARRWMPCNDNPYDKSLATITVKVPTGYTVVSNGLLDNTIVVPDSNFSIFKWHHNFPITTYLMNAVASKYHYYYDWYKRVSNPNDSIKIEYYVWERDFQDTTSSGLTYNATYAYRNVVGMMEFLSTIYGEYPFERYGMTAVQNAWFGGMEHQTITTLNRNVMRKINRWGYNADWGNQSVILHEMSHQWLGDYITCATWNDIWINEGGAVWSVALWAGQNGLLSYYNRMISERASYLWENSKNQQPAIYAPPIDNVFNYATTYAKGSWIYHMLGEMVGNEKFLGIMRDMLQDYAYQSLTTEDFKNFIKTKLDSPLVNLDTFFLQWVYKPGHPIYDVSMSTQTYKVNTDYNSTVNLKQLQAGDDIPNVFKTLVGLQFFGPDGKSFYTTVLNQQRDDNFNIRLTFMPDSIKIDTSRTLCVVNSYITSVRESNNAMDLDEVEVYPNPIYGGGMGHLNYSIQEASNVNIEIYDVIGNHIGKVYNGFLSTGTYQFDVNTADLANGVYYLNLRAGNKNVFRKFSAIR